MATLILTTDLEVGGTPTVVRELATRLHRCGAGIEVACLSTAGPVAQQIRSAGVSVTSLNATSARDLRILPRLIALIRQQKFNTVISFLFHANAVAAAASVVLRDVRWIQSIQTAQPYPVWHWVAQRFAQHAASIIVVPSASVARIAEMRAGAAPEKILIIPNAIDLSEWNGRRSTVPVTNPQPYPVTFLGRLDPIKDVPTLVKAVGKLTPLVQLHIYGEGADRARIERAIQTSDAPVTLHGLIKSPQEALSHSGLLVLPSLAEGFGLVLIEAMAAGVPVVATNVPGIRDVIRHGQNGLLVPPADPIALVDAIRLVVEDATLRAKLIHNGLDEVRSRYTWEAVLPQYQQLLGDRLQSRL